MIRHGLQASLLLVLLTSNLGFAEPIDTSTPTGPSSVNTGPQNMMNNTADSNVGVSAGSAANAGANRGLGTGMSTKPTGVDTNTGAAVNSGTGGVNTDIHNNSSMDANTGINNSTNN